VAALSHEPCICVEQNSDLRTVTEAKKQAEDKLMSTLEALKEAHAHAAEESTLRSQYEGLQAQCTRLVQNAYALVAL
jgi:hypothetical protein